jgi:putative heme-binding domain-containing protein
MPEDTMKAAVATLALLVPTFVVAADPPKTILLIAGTKSHGPGEHEYEKGARLLAHCINTSPNLKGFKAEVITDGWPKDEKVFDHAATVLLFSDGSDRDEKAHPLLREKHLATMAKLMERGVGFVAIHYTVFVPAKKGGADFLDWCGGYFDYESGPKPSGWYSKIKTCTGKVAPATPKHPISRGLKPFELREEFYYNMRLAPAERGLTPILSATLPDEKETQVVAWAVERKNGGRGFGYTGGHFHKNWQDDNVRRMVLNALVWTAHGEVPEGGVKSTPPDEERPIRALILTGHQHPAHDWKTTTKALQDVLGADPRMQVTVVEDPEFLAKKELAEYDVLLLNYVNHERPGLTAQARNGLMEFVEGGRGLVVVHFANGAFTDWPDYRKLARRAWVDKVSGHDAYGKFIVGLAEKDHPITKGLSEYETTDELYYKQQGDLPVEVLLTARSKATGHAEPMAFVSKQGKGAIFQTVLGHDADAIRNRGTAEVIRRGTAWAAGRKVMPLVAPPSPAPAAPLVEGRFGSALNAKARHAEAKYQAAYQKPPLTVECWAKLDGAAGFNVLVANNVKESNTHWEIYSFAGSGNFTAYLPGYAPDTIDSGVKITDGKWHYLAMTFDSGRVRLFADGKMVKEATVKARGGSTKGGALWFGGYPPQGIGCDGLLDEVRISGAVRTIDGVPDKPFVADKDTLGLWHFDKADGAGVEDSGSLKNPARVAAGAVPADNRGPSSDTELDYRPADPRLKALLIDRSLDESFVSIKADTTGRLFVGGREALFVYEPDDKGGYRPRRELFRFPPDAWVAGIEIRGDDLYVMTASALYRFPGGRTKRDGLKPERLVWGIPLDLHVSFHSLAWGPEGDLYLNHGDPLLGYGDFGRPDHWGHWTIFTKGGDKVPYTGNGGVFRVRPDGSNFRCVAGGLRGPFGLAFDRRWELFTNDNDHESRPDLYTPARLLHVTPHIDFGWPRGWIASKLPDRRDLVEAMHNVPGRGVPVGMAYYDEPLLPAGYRNTLLEARWDLLTVQRHTIDKRGASYSSKEQPFLVGKVRARPVGVAVGRGGRVFVAISYMAGNEASPHYPSDLVMVTTADDRPEHPFDPYDATTATAEKLFAELSQPSWERRRAAHVEILRRGGELLDEAARRLAKVTIGDPAINHLPWLAGAGGSPTAAKAVTYDPHLVPDDARFQALRVLAEFPALKAPPSVFAEALRDEDPRVRLEALAALFDESRELPLAAVMRPARDTDTYLRQTATKLLARRATMKDIVDLMESNDASVRLVAVLAAGFRLTVPRPHSIPPKEVPLFYPKGNAFFQTAIRYGDRPDERVELDKLGRVGSYTTAEMWKAITPSPGQKELFDLLSRGLKDSSEVVRLQAAYFVSLLRDPRTEVEVARVFAEVRERRLADVPVRNVGKAWAVGPFAADDAGPESGAVDLTTEYTTAMGKVVWRELDGKDGVFTLPKAEGPRGTPLHYLCFRLQSPARQTALLTARSDMGVKVWFNGRPVEDRGSEIPLDVQPGSNDVLIRGPADGKTITLRYRGRTDVTATLPEKSGGATLARRLKEGGGKGEAVPAEFLTTDWTKEAKKGDAAQGRKLFGSLGCAKCHAITADQTGGGAPSLADAGKRFNVAYLVESVLLPSRQVADQFRTTVITTRQGVTLTGLVVGETADAVELLQPDTTRKPVRKKDVEERKTSNLSPMPAGLVKKPDELRDLLAYLLSERPLPP